MPKRNTMTALAFESVKPRAKRFELLDDGVKGLRLVVQPSGHKTWAVRYRQAGRLRKYTIGDFGTVKLEKVRKLAANVLLKVTAGDDPQAAKVVARRRAQAGLDRQHLLGAVYTDRYLPHAKKTMRPKSVANIETQFKLTFLPKFQRRPLAEIEPAEVLAVIEKAGDPAHAFAVGRTFFRWCVSKLLIPRSPMEGLKSPVSGTKPRDRILSNDEIKMLWRAADTMAYPFGPLAKLLLLTGARLREVAEMQRDELDFDKRIWTIPAPRVKNKREHIIHLSDAAIEILKGLPAMDNKKGFVFTTTNEGPVSGFSKMKVILDKHMAKIVAADDDDKNIPHWTLHDLRRTCATGMASIGVNIAVVERALNHISGVTGGRLINTYQHHDFADERRDAFQRWGEHVTKLVVTES